MIDDIVEMILKEARRRKKQTFCKNARAVLREVEDRVYSIMVDHLNEERRKQEDD